MMSLTVVSLNREVLKQKLCLDCVFNKFERQEVIGFSSVKVANGEDFRTS